MNSTTNHGGPAFPCRLINTYGEPIEGMCGETLPPKTTSVYGGMTLRDYLAAAALKGMLSNANKTPPYVSGTELRSPGHYAAAAYRQADAMLEARNA